jgi:predicted DNA-binding transcriptional regulator AlpA
VINLNSVIDRAPLNFATLALTNWEGSRVSEKRYLTTADVAALLGVNVQTVRAYRVRSREGGTYAANPFPKPDEIIGQSPVWLPERADEIKQWAASRVGRGVGGGTPSHRRPRP